MPTAGHMMLLHAASRFDHHHHHQQQQQKRQHHRHRKQSPQLHCARMGHRCYHHSTSSSSSDIDVEDDVVPIDFSRVSDDLLRLVRRTYHLYMAYRIMEPPRCNRSKARGTRGSGQSRNSSISSGSSSSSLKRRRLLSSQSDLTEPDDDNSDIETYAKRIKTLCSSLENNDERPHTPLKEAGSCSELEPRICRKAINESRPDSAMPLPEASDAAEEANSCRMNGGNTILDNFMRDLSNVKRFENGQSTEHDPAGRDGGADWASTAERAIEEGLDVSGEKNLADICEALPPVVKTDDPEHESLAENEQTAKTQLETLGVHPETREDALTTRGLSSPRPQRLAHVANHYIAKLPHFGSNSDAVRLHRMPPLLRAVANQRERSIRRLRSRRITAGFPTSRTGDQEKNVVRRPRLTRQAKRGSQAGDGGIDLYSSGVACRECFVIIEKLDLIRFSSEQKVTHAAGVEPTSLGRNSPKNLDVGDSRHGDVGDEEVGQEESTPAAEVSQTDCQANGGEDVGSESRGSSERSEGLQCLNITTDHDSVQADGSETERPPDMANSSIRSKVSVVKKLLARLISSTPPEETDAATSDLDEDVEPQCFAELFGAPAAGQRRRADQCARGASAASVTLLSQSSSSQIASSLLGAAVSLLIGSTKRSVASARRSERLLSRDSGFADGEDSQGQLVGLGNTADDDDSPTKLSEYWTRRRRQWELSDIHDEVHELLGFVPAASPPRTLAPIHIPAAVAAAHHLVAASKRKAARVKKAAIDFDQSNDAAAAKRAARVTTVQADMASGHMWQSRDTLRASVSKRSGRSIRPPEHMNI